jgi:hypothetical protein
MMKMDRNRLKSIGDERILLNERALTTTRCALSDGDLLLRREHTVRLCEQYALSGEQVVRLQRVIPYFAMSS